MKFSMLNTMKNAEVIDPIIPMDSISVVNLIVFFKGFYERIRDQSMN